MLLRNLDPPKLCNRKRLTIKGMMQRVPQAIMTGGKCTGKHVFISKILIKLSDLPFEFKRVQFAVRLIFAVNINKAKGQSMKEVELNLTVAVFSHGHIYFGFSRLGNPEKLHILAPGGRTENFIHLEAT